VVAVTLGCAAPLARIAIDYPADGAIFPPEITPPVFEWRDGSKTAVTWRIAISFSDGAPGIMTLTKGPRPKIGEIDPDCAADTNEPPRLTAPGRRAHLDSQCGGLGDHQETVQGWRCHHHNYGLERRQARHGGLARTDPHTHLHGSGGRAHFLS